MCEGLDVGSTRFLLRDVCSMRKKEICGGTRFARASYWDPIFQKSRSLKGGEKRGDDFEVDL